MLLVEFISRWGSVAFTSTLRRVHERWQSPDEATIRFRKTEVCMPCRSFTKRVEELLACQHYTCSDIMSNIFDYFVVHSSQEDNTKVPWTPQQGSTVDVDVHLSNWKDTLYFIKIWEGGGSG